ncbi:NAD(P)/FAD-dependent oxidoreductase [soil metagenome]
MSKLERYDAVVIGAGLTGMYQLYKLRELGMSVRGYEIAPDVGGTWYWNRYPGCRVDTESFAYCYAFSHELLQEWTWTEHYASQPEVLRYLNYAADKMDIRKDFQFETMVNKVEYDEVANFWTVQLGDGSSVRTRFLISAAGPLSVPQMPNYKGIDEFRGESYHSYYWPRDTQGGTGGLPVDLRGKRVGVIGTGSTGVQIITQVAKTAGELFVFQRSPNWCTPLRNSPLPKEKMDSIKADYDTFLNFCKSTHSAFPYKFIPKSALDVTDAEREEVLERLYNSPGYGIWFGNFQDLFTNREANRVISEFIAGKIRSRVNDPVLAEKLVPKNHGFGTKRVPMESGYYEVYNQDNVHLVDVKEDPIQRITAAGVQTAMREYELDVLIYATGFDAVTGALDRMEIVGKGGQTLKQAWADGPLTYLGLQIQGFPNFFTLVAAHNGASFCNIALCSQMQVEWVDKMFHHIRDQDVTYVEPTGEAVETWTAEVYRILSKTIFGDTDSWFLGVNTNVAGKQERRPLVYAGGAVKYQETCDEIERMGYKGFDMRKTIATG